MTQKSSNKGLQDALQSVENGMNNLPAQTPKTSVDPYRKAQSYLKAMMPAISEALPKSKGMDAERLSRMTLTTLKQNPKLLECSIESLLGAVLQSAQLGLEPNLLGSCYFIPYKGTCSFQIGYKGLIDLATRNGQVINIVAQEVRQGDQFHFEFGRNETLIHVPAPMSTRGEVYAYYAYAHLKNGGFAFQVMSLDEIEKIRDTYSMAYKFDKQNSIWSKNFDSMAKKTVIKALIKYLPLSIETANAIAHDETIRKDISAEVTPIYVDSVDYTTGEILDKQEENVG